MYRPPSEPIQNFIDSLIPILTNDTLSNAEIVLLAGDMNVNLLDSNSQSVNAYRNIMNSLFFIPSITKATRFPNDLTRETPSNLDHIWLNKIVPFSAGILNIDFTDHCPVFIRTSIISCYVNKFKQDYASIETFLTRKF